MYIHVYADVYVCIQHTRVSVCVYIYTYTHIYIYICIYTYIHMCGCAYTQIYMIQHDMVCTISYAVI